ncbi:hypothetical protein [Tropicimonas marinistellae]|uniref:hypothetical protein n=1 Tax=Tropicimonas marinistellae TaxID=1739787 RepID=UPI00082F8119|nr:hypothetical protein [Tropicimonas marinistellae]
MTSATDMHEFIDGWFRNLDQLVPAAVFLANLDPEVEWNMEDAVRSLSGHDRFRARYAGTVAPRCIHDISEGEVADGTARFTARFRGELKVGGKIDARVRETWACEMRPDGSPNITHNKAEPIQEDETV